MAELDKMLSPEARTIMHHVLRDFRRDARYSKSSDHREIFSDTRTKALYQGK